MKLLENYIRGGERDHDGTGSGIWLFAALGAGRWWRWIWTRGLPGSGEKRGKKPGGRDWVVQVTC